MIPLSSIQRTAEELMAKAAIEIPQDYLDGLRRCADTEKGDLSAFVIKAMLESGIMVVILNCHHPRRRMIQ